MCIRRKGGLGGSPNLTSDGLASPILLALWMVVAPM